MMHIELLTIIFELLSVIAYYDTLETCNDQDHRTFRT